MNIGHQLVVCQLIITGHIWDYSFDKYIESHKAHGGANLTAFSVKIPNNVHDSC